MKDLLSKEHYYHKIHKSLTKSSACPTLSFTDHIYKILSPAPFYDFSKFSTP